MKNPGENSKEFVDSFAAPVLLVQAEPRQVVTANRKACELFGKDLSLIEGFRGGQVFNCIHAFSEAGCGLDPNCEGCKIKSAVVDTFTTGRSQPVVRTVLDIKEQHGITPYEIEISTDKVGDFIMITIRNYSKKGIIDTH